MKKQNKGTEVAVVTTSPMTLMELAIEKGADIVTIEKLMALKERWDAQQAKKAFLKALSEFQAECPVIKKDKKVSFTSKRTGFKTEYNYAPLGSIIKQIKSLLKKYGLSYRWETTDTDGKITIKCITSHLDGHSEGNSMSSNKDDSGGKNDIQQIGSTMTYLQRYTLIGAFGISTADDDLDVQQIPKSKTPTQINISKAKSTELLSKAKIVIDEYTVAKDLQANYKGYVKDQVKAGMHQVDIDILKKYINGKNVSLKKGSQTEPIDLP